MQSCSNKFRSKTSNPYTSRTPEYQYVPEALIKRKINRNMYLKTWYWHSIYLGDCWWSWRATKRAFRTGSASNNLACFGTQTRSNTGSCRWKLDGLSKLPKSIWWWRASLSLQRPLPEDLKRSRCTPTSLGKDCWTYFRLQIEIIIIIPSVTTKFPFKSSKQTLPKFSMADKTL